jgi:hypothetical protein
MFKRKTTYILTFIILLSACCGNHSEIDKTSGSSGDKTRPQITLYYLHQKRQCKTCKAIGLVKYENHFLSDAPSLAEKYKCVFAGIYIVASSDTIETISDLTKPSFYLATSNPDSLEKLLVQTIRIKLDSIKKNNSL